MKKSLKKIISILTSAALTSGITAVPMQSSDFDFMRADAEIVIYSDQENYEDTLYYVKADEDKDGVYDYVEISDCNVILTEINIPDEIDGLPVKKIGYLSFWGSNVESIVIPDSVTAIGESAFLSCPNLRSIIIPQSVVSIEEYAFSNCTSLTDISIPDGVTSLEAAFSCCENLQNVTLPESITSIGNHTFELCSNLTSITLPTNITMIGENCFRSCKSLKSITIPDTVTEIGAHAFSGCEILDNIIIPNGVTTIGYGAFSTCTNLTDITLPDSITSIEGSAFSLCTSLSNITLPENITVIEDGIFSHCSKLNDIVLHNNITSIGEAAFSGCSSLRSISIPESVTYIGNQAFHECIRLKNITFDFYNCEISDSEYTISDSATIHGYTNSTAQAYADKYERSFVAIDEYIESTEPTNPEETTEPTEPVMVGDGNGDNKADFADYLILDSYLRDIISSEEASQYADLLAWGDVDCNECISVADSFYLFKMITNNSAKEGENPDGFGIKASDITVDYGTTSAEIELNITDEMIKSKGYQIEISSESEFITFNQRLRSPITFGIEKDNGYVLAVVLSEDIADEKAKIKLNIDSKAPSGTYPINVKVVYLDNNGTEVASPVGYAGSVTIKPDPAATTATTKVTTTVTTTTTLATYDEAYYIEQLDYEKIDENADGEYDYIEIIECNETVVSMIIPEQIEGLPVKKIGRAAIGFCSELKLLEIPETVTIIESGAFYGCSSLEEIIIPDSVKSLSDKLFYNCTSLEKVQFPEGISEIGNSMFYNCSSLEEITIPDTVKTIGTETFYGCNALTTVYLPEGIDSIGKSAFKNCCSLENIILPTTITSIGDESFYGCNSLKKFIVPKGVEEIGAGTFGNCEKLKSITIENPLCDIPDDESVFFEFTIIYGYSLSTSSVFASKYNREFRLLGDINNDGQYNISDGVLIKKHLLKHGHMNEDEYMASDMHCDGRINVFDFILLKRMLLGQNL